MIREDKVRGAVTRAIEQARMLSVDGDSWSTDDSSVLLGDESTLGSMATVNLIVALEEEMGKLLGRQINLLEELSPTEPKREHKYTIGKLIDWLSKHVEG